jgi:hypothetical protein
MSSNATLDSAELEYAGDSRVVPWEAQALQQTTIDSGGTASHEGVILMNAAHVLFFGGSAERPAAGTQCAVNMKRPTWKARPLSSAAKRGEEDRGPVMLRPLPPR